MSLFQSFSSWLLLDVLFVETIVVYLFYIFSPLAISSELLNTKSRICSLVSNAVNTPDLHTNNFEIASYFNTSNRLMANFICFESLVIASYRTTLLDYCNDSDHSVYRRFFHWIFKKSIFMQDVIMKSLIYLLVGGFCVFCYELYVTLVPIGVLYGVVGFAILLFILFLFSHRLYIRNYIHPLSEHTVRFPLSSAQTIYRSLFMIIYFVYLSVFCFLFSSLFKIFF